MITFCKIRSLICLAFSMIALAGFAQNASNEDKPIFFPKTFGLNNSVSVGILGGAMDNFNYGLAGINASVYGVYVDFMGWPRANAGDTNISIEGVNVDVHQRRSQLAAHIGYQIPFHKYQDGSIRIIPVVGLTTTSIRSESKVGYNGSSNSYHATAKDTKVDYGGVLAFESWDKNIGYINFFVGVTRYTAWIGLGVDFHLGHSK